MTNKSIKTKGQQTKVVNELVNDMQAAIDFYNAYQVKKENNDKVIVHGTGFCPIITESAFGIMMEVYNAYHMIYPSISYHLDITEYNGKTIPAIEIIVGITHKFTQIKTI